MLNQRQLFLRHVAQTSDAPLLIEIERADGVTLYGPNQKEYLDLISGISVSSLGHGNKKVIEAIQQQSEKYLHLMVYGELVQAPQVDLAKKLSDLLPSPLESVYFVNSGSEAIEGALKLAKRYTGRTKIMAMKNAYHGNTHAAMSLMNGNEYKNAFGPLLPDIEFMNFNDLEEVKRINRSFAAVILETIQGEAGYIPAEIEFLQAIRKKCEEEGVLLILDEIQCGMGRTGKLFAFEHYNIQPDILVLAKAFGAGLPLGAFISSQPIMSVLTHHPVLGHITTFGGHPLCCSAALAGLNELYRLDLMSGIAKKEALFRELLHHPKIKSISGKGLMLSIEFNDFEENKRFIDACMDKGVFTDWFLYASNKMRISPPLIIHESEIRKACAVILSVLNSED